MRRALLALAALLTLAPAAGAEQAKAYFQTNYDLDATSYTYCVTTGKNGDPFGAPREGNSAVTAAASTTVAATTANTFPFLFVSVGDVLFFKDTVGAVTVRYVTARASGDSITVDASTTVTAANFTFLKVSCGTAVTDGWINVAGWKTKKISTYIEQMNVTGGIDVRWECRDATIDSQIVQVYPASGANNYTTAGITSGTSVVIEEPWDACRIGYKIGSADDGGDLTTNTEQIHAWLEVWK